MYKPRLIYCLLAVIVSVSSCYDENNTYGESLVDSVFRNVTMDTSTVTVSSMMIDSLQTSGIGVVLAGKFNHSLWGSVTASSYIAYNRPSYNQDVDDVVTLDSLVLVLRHSGRFAGDTTQRLNLNVHQLTNRIVLNDNGYLYNRSTVPYDAEILGSCSYRPMPADTSRLFIRLSDELGKDLLEKFHNRDIRVSTDLFEEYFMGLVIMPAGDANQSLLTYAIDDTSAVLSLYYRVSDELENKQVLTFNPNTTTQFNNITHDKTGSLMEDYADRTVIASELLGNRGLLMGGIGWYASLGFPYLNNIMQHGEQVEIESALLKIYPEPDTYSGYNLLPDSIYLYIADENNVVTDAVMDYLGEEVQSGVLVRDDTFRENTFYYFDVTDFMQQELGTIGMYKHSLQLVFGESDYTGTIRNLTFSDQRGRAPVVLQLTYKIYESY